MSDPTAAEIAEVVVAVMVQLARSRASAVPVPRPSAGPSQAGPPPPLAAPIPQALPGPPVGPSSWSTADAFAAGEAAGAARMVWSGSVAPVRAPPPPPPEEGGARPVDLRPARDVRRYEGKGKGKTGGWAAHQALPGPSSAGHGSWEHEEEEEETEEMDHSGWPDREVQRSGHGGGSCSGCWPDAPASPPGESTRRHWRIGDGSSGGDWRADGH